MIDCMSAVCMAATAGEDSVLTEFAFNALTESLCSHNLAGAVKRIKRMGILNSCATPAQCFRVSMSAFVLSGDSKSVLSAA
jgi:hypothetical protein